MAKASKAVSAMNRLLPNPNALNILLQIARCPEKLPALSECNLVKSQQSHLPLNDIQLPEPWRGDIDRAKLLFVNSNPGWGPNDSCPTRSSLDVDVAQFYESGFPKCFPRGLTKAGKPTQYPIKFWASVRARALELYGRKEIVPGRDFALTEVVHCKSISECGDQQAATVCTERHFHLLAPLSRASVLVGSQAEIDTLSC